MDPSVRLAITFVKETAQTDLRRTSSTQVIMLIEDILADPRVTADDTVQTEQSTDADFNKRVCNSNDPHRAKRVRQQQRRL